jgi:glycosyltransferase involved in cell wall biosynthesis
VIGTVARLFELKGYEYFIPAAAQIADKHSDVKFLIVGNGLLREKLEKQIKELGLTENFIFAGLIPPSEVYKYIAQMDILAHLSLREGLPRAVVQALASGKPAIGFNLDGTPEVIINDESGYILPPMDIDGVANAAIELLNNPAKAKEMGINGRNIVKEKFDWQYMVNELLNDYTDGLQNTTT